MLGNTSCFIELALQVKKALIVSSVVANNYDAESEQRINHTFIGLRILLYKYSI